MTAISPQPFTITGYATRDGQALNNQLGYPTVASENAITATVSGTQTNSYPVTAPITRITTVASSADGVLMPTARAGKWMVLINSGSNPMQVFASGTDTINGTAGSTGVSQTNGAVTIYFCPVQGSWFSK